MSIFYQIWTVSFLTEHIGGKFSLADFQRSNIFSCCQEDCPPAGEQVKTQNLKLKSQNYMLKLKTKKP